MSIDLSVIQQTGVKSVQLQVTQFAGPADRGLMVQLSQGFGTGPDEPGFIQLSRKDVEQLIPVLLSWLNSTDPQEAGFQRWYDNFWKYGSSTDLIRARRAFEAAKSDPDYGHKLLERIIETDRAIPALVFRGITIEHFIAYLQTHFPNYHCVRDLAACDQVTPEMLKCISRAVTLTAGDAAYIVDFQRNANAREGSK